MPQGSVDCETKAAISAGMRRYWKRRKAMGKQAELYDRLTRADLERRQRIADRAVRRGG